MEEKRKYKFLLLLFVNVFESFQNQELKMLSHLHLASSEPSEKARKRISTHFARATKPTYFFMVT